MRDFRNLGAWHKAHAFTLHVYQVTESFPKSETYGIAATLRRRSADMTMKIAEACGKDVDSDYKLGLSHARGVGLEVESIAARARPSLHEA